MRLYLVRHGESENNAAGLWTGWTDAALTPKGEQQAENIRPILASVKFDKILSSDLSRAINTAKIAIPDCNPEPLSMLREIHIGSLEGTPNAKNDDSARLAVQNGYAEFGGESRAEFSERVAEFIAYVEGLKNVDTLAVFSHAGFCRNFLNQVTKANLTSHNMLFFNCGVLIFDYTNDNWFLHGLINR